MRLVRLQRLADAIRQASGTVDEAPGRLEEIEARFRERNAEYVAIRERHEAVAADQRARQGELALLEEQRKKYMDDLMQVQNQREYSAMLREIDGIKSRIGEHEDAVLRDMEELETLSADMASQESHIGEERERVAQERNQVEAAVDEARRTIERLRVERAAIEAELPSALVALAHRLEGGRGGVFLAAAEQGVCQSCYVRVRPQVFQEIKLGAGIHTCGSCRRLLYHPLLVGDSRSQTLETPGADVAAADPLADDPEAERSTAKRDAGNVQALNGGAV